MAKRPLRTAVVLTLAAVGPFATIWVASDIVARANKRPAPRAVTLFSDYFTEPTAPVVTALPSARVVWTGSPNAPPTAMFKDLAVVGSDVVVAGDTRLFVIEPDTGRIKRELPLPAALQGVSKIRSLANANRVSTYSFDSGQFGLIDLAAGNPVHTIKLDPALRQPILHGERIISNGAFANELLRVYAEAPAGSEPSAATVIERAGLPLFPGITPKFSRQLNATVMDLSPDGARLALAFKWSDRINIYDARSLRLERSIAGPVETKLSFGVDTFGGELMFVSDDEATHSYADVVATNAAVLAMYSGLEKRKHRAALGLGVALHVFTWDGRLIGQWALPEPVQEIALDAGSATLYALRYRPKPAVLAIDAGPIMEAVNTIADAPPNRRTASMR